ncbi:hypothetical protein EDF46_1632 [Frondihabitans sp. PhB188]|uniref:hypothetical protein n=1 Tax=Frondihabitans sp. PhB188 TaxID=2485200 RepID=UPI000F47649E|nr:hypothetical protein [Frondihabitans sp. PhB188]ROQ39997.1 hypothetical protein EDF46_1632 [Frondihabitans sp. PhB188]
MTDTLADDLAAVVRSVPGVAAIYPRPGFAQLARSVIGTVTKTTPQVAVALSATQTRVELDVAVGPEHSGPAVARTVAAAVLDHLAARGAPGPGVDVRIVALG